jgi:hypothetical protein
MNPVVYEVKVRVTLQIDADSPQELERVKRAAKEAIANALNCAEGNGFEHCLADEVSIGVADVEPVSVSREGK